jgi:DNA ligase (NAD+)
MCREKLIAAKNIDDFTKEAAARGNVELTAVILSYQNSLGTKEVSKARDRREKIRDKQDDIIVDRIAARADKVGIDGLNFVVTGGLNHFANRDDIKAYITSRGGKLMSAMSAKTDYLITNDTDTGSAKNVKAADLGIVVITEDEFLKMAEGKKA